MRVRKEKLSSLIKEILSECIQFRLKDPRIGVICITDVILNSDNSIAKVYFSSVEDDKEGTMKGLTSARGYLRHFLAREVKLRKVPDIRFYYDDSSEFILKSEKLQDTFLHKKELLLEKMKKKRVLTIFFVNIYSLFILLTGNLLWKHRI